MRHKLSNRTRILAPFALSLSGMSMNMNRAAAKATPATSPAIETDLPIDQAAVLTGRDSPNNTGEQWDVYGTDLGHSFLYKGEMFIVFGDTFAQNTTDWRSNVATVTADDDPADGIAISDRMFLHYMSVSHWGEPGHWDLGSSGWAYSDDAGQTWVKDPDATWPGDSNFGQVALEEHEGHIYIWGTPGGRYGGVMLAGDLTGGPARHRPL